MLAQRSAALVEYGTIVKQALNSDLEAFEEAEVDALVQRDFKQWGKSRGALANFKVAQHIINHHRNNREQPAP